MDAVATFLDSALARRMTEAPPGRLMRELPFTLRIEAPAGERGAPDVVIRGQLDALLLDRAEATVIDYKLSRSAAMGRYDFQLDAYALAADSLTQSAVPVRSGLVFLRSPSAPQRPHLYRPTTSPSAPFLPSRPNAHGRLSPGTPLLSPPIPCATRAPSIIPTVLCISICK